MVDLWDAEAAASPAEPTSVARSPRCPGAGDPRAGGEVFADTLHITAKGTMRDLVAERRQ